VAPKPPSIYDFDQGLRNLYGELLCGVDEAGRGPLAGPVAAAAVILPPAARFEGLDDSKKLSEATRERLYGEITKTAIAWSVVMIDEKVIDELNILEATMEGMKQAVEALSCTPHHILVDGNRRPRFVPFIRSDILPKADERSASVAAASVLAKVSRDRLMVRLSEEFPEYGFEKHKGYPTKQHYQALEAHGSSPIHRESFLKRWQEKMRAEHKPTYQMQMGRLGEQTVGAFLKAKGWEILQYNYRCPEGEIDIVAKDPEGMIAFVEVKARRGVSPRFGRPRDAVNYGKRQRLIRAARDYLWHRGEARHRFDVAEVFFTVDAMGPRVLSIEYIEDLFTYDDRTGKPSW